MDARGWLVALSSFVAISSCTTDNAVQSSPDLPTACEPGKANCGGACVDVQTNAANCGGCGMRCAFGEVCAAGKCALFCRVGLTACGIPASCVDTARDPARCGSCDTACDPGLVC